MTLKPIEIRYLIELKPGDYDNVFVIDNSSIMMFNGIVFDQIFIFVNFIVPR